jgi:predicted RNA binding protein YcfA (HicA-like mRNA interferase family)
MTQRLAPIARRDLIRRLRKLGWAGPESGTKHEFMVLGSRKLRLPNPHQGDISRELVGELLKQAGISVEHWNNA